MYKLLVIGFSAGGFPLITSLLQALPKDYPLPIALVTHISGELECNLPIMLNSKSELQVSMATDKEQIVSGQVYLAPPGYHLMIEQHKNARPSFALSVDNPVKAVRPSIDVLFTSAAEAFESALIAVLLSGANSDGAEGMTYVKQLGGLTIVLDPVNCEFNTMAIETLKRVDVDYVVSIDEIISLLLSVSEKP
jgi:two-component system chemotaxis response regulator CheB